MSEQLSTKETKKHGLSNRTKKAIATLALVATGALSAFVGAKAQEHGDAVEAARERTVATAQLQAAKDELSKAKVDGAAKAAQGRIEGEMEAAGAMGIADSINRSLHAAAPKKGEILQMGGPVAGEATVFAGDLVLSYRGETTHTPAAKIHRPLVLPPREGESMAEFAQTGWVIVQKTDPNGDVKAEAIWLGGYDVKAFDSQGLEIRGTAGEDEIFDQTFTTKQSAKGSGEHAVNRMIECNDADGTFDPAQVSVVGQFQSLLPEQQAS